MLLAKKLITYLQETMISEKNVFLFSKNNLCQVVQVGYVLLTFFLIKTKIIQSRIFIHILSIGNTHQVNQKTLVISDSIREQKIGSLKRIQFKPRSYVIYLSTEFFIKHTTRFFVYNLNKLQQASLETLQRLLLSSCSLSTEYCFVWWNICN